MVIKIGEEKTKRILVLISALFLLVAAAGITYYAFKFIMSPHDVVIINGENATTGTQQNQTPAEYAESELVKEYGVGSIPHLVINCEYQRVGTYAMGEQYGKAPAGTERQDLINGLCEATGNAILCSETEETAGSVPLIDTGKPACGSDDGKIMIYAFHSPSCPACNAQKPVLDSLESEYESEIKIVYVCKYLHSGDKALCQEGVENGEYDE